MWYGRRNYRPHWDRDIHLVCPNGHSDSACDHTASQLINHYARAIAREEASQSARMRSRDRVEEMRREQERAEHREEERQRREEALELRKEECERRRAQAREEKERQQLEKQTSLRENWDALVGKKAEFEGAFATLQEETRQYDSLREHLEINKIRLERETEQIDQLRDERSSVSRELADLNRELTRLNTSTAPTSAQTLDQLIEALSGPPSHSALVFSESIRALELQKEVLAERSVLEGQIEGLRERQNTINERMERHQSHLDRLREENVRFSESIVDIKTSMDRSNERVRRIIAEANAIHSTIQALQREIGERYATAEIMAPFGSALPLPKSQAEIVSHASSSPSALEIVDLASTGLDLVGHPIKALHTISLAAGAVGHYRSATAAGEPRVMAAGIATVKTVEDVAVGAVTGPLSAIGTAAHLVKPHVASGGIPDAVCDGAMAAAAFADSFVRGVLREVASVEMTEPGDPLYGINTLKPK